MNNETSGQPPSSRDAGYNRRDADISQLRIPPHSTDAEQAVLGALMLDPAALTDLSLSVEDFYRRDHQLIFRSIQETAEKGHAFDAVTLGEWFESQGQIEQVAGGAYLVELASTTPSAANIAAYAEIVKTLSVKRQLIELGTDIINRGFNCEEPAGIISDGMSMLALAASRASNENQEPINLFGDNSYPALKAEYLPPIVSSWVFDRAEVMGTAPEMIAMSAIATASASIHDNFRLQPKPGEDWNERACLWLMVVADPSSKKSAAMEVALAPMQEINSRLARESEAQAATYDSDMRVAKMAQRGRDRMKAKALNGEIVGYDETDDAMPSKPPAALAMVNDTTIEKLADLLVDNPRGMLMYNDELSGWVGRMISYASRGDGSNRSHWLKLYGGGHETIARVGSGVKSIPNWSCGVMGTIQPEKIAEIVGQGSDDGLWQRFMTITVPNAHRPAQEREYNRVDYKRYCDAIRGSWERQPPEKAFVSLSKGAHAVRRPFFDWVERVASSDGMSPLLRGHIGKWTGLWSRLVLTYHCLACIPSGKWPTEVEVSEATAKRVTDLLLKYLLPHSMIFYNDTLGQTDVIFGSARTIAAMILAKGVTRLANRDLAHLSKQWRDRSEGQKQAIITLLSESGWLIGADTKRKREGSDTAWAVNPAVHIQFSGRAALEAAKRAQMAQVMRDIQDAAAGRDS